jgi:hypothetical protein
LPHFACAVETVMEGWGLARCAGVAVVSERHCVNSPDRRLNCVLTRAVLPLCLRPDREFPVAVRGETL